MNSIARLAAAVAAAAMSLPAAAQAANPAPPLCLHPSPFAGAAFGAKTNPTLPGQTVAFDGSCSRVSVDIGFSSVPPDYWTWDFGDGTTGSGPTPSHVYTAAGTYTVTVGAWTHYDGGPTQTISQTITVLP
jgi:hypothetical protein